MVANLVINTLAAGRVLKARDSFSHRIIYSSAMVGIVGLWQFGEKLLEPCCEALRWLQSQNPQLDFGWEQQFIATAIDLGKGNVMAQEVMAEQRTALIGLEDKMTRCVLCEGSFKWEDLTIAECSGGHRYRESFISKSHKIWGYPNTNNGSTISKMCHHVPTDTVWAGLEDVLNL